MRVAEAGVFLIVAWGALSFGAVYSWGFGPLLVAALAIAVTVWRRAGRSSFLDAPALALAAAVMCAAILVQVLPMPQPVLARISPRTDATLRSLDLVYGLRAAAGQDAWHALSIKPSATWLGLVCVAAFMCLLLALSRLFSVRGARRTADRIVWFGLLLAIFGVIQRSSRTTMPYGLWVSGGTDPFGPFINKDHFAGWMLMGLGLALGSVGAAMFEATAVRSRRRHARFFWLSSPEVARLALLVLAAGVMALSLVMTRSRAGLASFVVASAFAALAVAHQWRTTTARKVVAIGFTLLLPAAAVAWVGAETVAGHFADARWHDLGHRTAVWRDAMHIVRDFPLAGTGFNTFGTAMVFYDTTGTNLRFREAHNDYLQLLSEGGILVTLPAVLTGIMFSVTVRRRFREHGDTPQERAIRVGALVGLAGIALQELVDFCLQMPGNAALMVVLAAIAIHRPPTEKPVHESI